MKNINDKGAFFTFNILNKPKRNDNNVSKLLWAFIDIDKKDINEFNKVKEYLNNNYVKYSYTAESGSGYHILIPINLNVEYNYMVSDFLKYLKSNISNVVDSTVGNSSRLMRIPESIHFKRELFRLQTLEINEVTEEEIKINNNFIKTISNSINETHKKKEVEENQDIISKLELLFKKDKAIEDLFTNKNIPQRFYKESNGKLILDRSKAEQSLVDKLVMNGFITFEEIDEIMELSKIGKWIERDDSYRNKTFDNAIKNLQKSLQSGKDKKESSSNVLDYLKKSEIKYDRLGCGIHNNTFYFGKAIQNNEGRYHNIIITSDRKVYTTWKNENDEIRDIFGLNYRDDFAIDSIDYLWRHESIIKWIENEEDDISIIDIYNQIKSLNEEYLVHEDSRVHSYIACDIIASYFLPIFNARGRTYFHAEFGSGKSKQSLIYKMLCFNPVFTTRITPATMDRIVESSCATLIIDNLDNLDDNMKMLVNQFIEVFYLSNGKNVKAEGTVKIKSRGFKGFASMVINNIIGLNPVTESRCNTIYMLKTNNREITFKKINEKDETWHKIRDELHIFALKNWKEIEKIYKKLRVPELSHRDLEKAESVLAIAKFISKEVFEELVDFFVDMSERQKDNATLDNDWEALLFEILERHIDRREFTRLTCFDIKKYAKDGLEDIDEGTLNKYTRWVGKKLRPYSHIIKKYRSCGRTGYEYYKKDLEKIMFARGLKKGGDNSQK